MISSFPIPGSLPVSLQDVLEARERRADMQAELRSLYNATVVSITVNVPGRIKYNGNTVQLIYGALDKVRTRILDEGFMLLEERICHYCTGPSALVAVQGDAYRLKELAVQIEEESNVGRLLDIDVFDSGGRQINRSLLGLPERACFVCPEAAVDCMRESRHSVEAIADAVQKLFTHQIVADASPWPKKIEIIGSLALEAMLLEVACTPAPGLVDRLNSGAHRDMDLFLFMKSSSALAPAMYRCAQAAWHHKGPNQELLPVLRRIGVKAEQAMFEATGGVNTQKGLLFLMGIVAAATALAARKKGHTNFIEAVLGEAAGICQGLVKRELDRLRKHLPSHPLTPGERLYLNYGITGIRGEIEAGLPVVVRRGLPGLRDALDKGLSLNDALVHALLYLMTESEDTTILNRHDMSVLKSVQQDAADILQKGGMLTDEGRRSIEQLDHEYIKRNISPGGSADLLAVTYFLSAVEEKLTIGM
jgi:holo-ACP synthase/triphosphoribosyl-dephospho-CoA synthase